MKISQLGNQAARNAFVREVITKAGCVSREKLLARIRKNAHMRVRRCGKPNPVSVGESEDPRKAGRIFVPDEDEERQEDVDAGHSGDLAPWLRYRPRR